MIWSDDGGGKEKVRSSVITDPITVSNRLFSFLKRLSFLALLSLSFGISVKVAGNYFNRQFAVEEASFGASGYRREGRLGQRKSV